MLAKISFIGSILYPLSRFNTVLLHSTLSLSLSHFFFITLCSFSPICKVLWCSQVKSSREKDILNLFAWKGQSITLNPPPKALRSSTFAWAETGHLIETEVRRSGRVNWSYSSSVWPDLGKKSPLWQHFKSLWVALKVLLNVRQHFDPIMAKKSCYWANLLCFKWPNVEKIIWPSGHTALLKGLSAAVAGAADVAVADPHLKKFFSSFFRRWKFFLWNERSKNCEINPQGLRAKKR